MAGVSGRQLADQIGISQSKVSRIESGAAVPSRPEVRAWGRALKVSVETQERLDFLTESSFTEIHPYRAELQRRTQLQDSIQEREGQAWRTRTYQPSVVPGLLQTAGYARHVFAQADPPYEEDHLADAVGGRLHRQLALYDESKQFEFLVTEAALRWRPGPVTVLLPQLDRIQSVSTLDNVLFGVIPMNVESTVPPSHGFALYDHKEDDRDTFAEIETIHATVAVNDTLDVDRYERRWSSLQQMALFGDEARVFLTALATDLRSHTV